MSPFIRLCVNTSLRRFWQSSGTTGVQPVIFRKTVGGRCGSPPLCQALSIIDWLRTLFACQPAICMFHKQARIFGGTKSSERSTCCGDHQFFDFNIHAWPITIESSWEKKKTKVGIAHCFFSTAKTQRINSIPRIFLTSK